MPGLHADCCGTIEGEGGSVTTTNAEVRVYGMCAACGSVEVALDSPTGTRDFSMIGEPAEYPVGYGCEVCS